MVEELSMLSPDRLKIDDRALQELITLVQNDERKNLKVRLFIEGGGCAGLRYGLLLDDQIEPDDQQLQRTFGDDILTILIDPISGMYLREASVDYVSDECGSRFVIQNPHVQTSCGCGSRCG